MLSRSMKKSLHLALHYISERYKCQIFIFSVSKFPSKTVSQTFQRDTLISTFKTTAKALKCHLFAPTGNFQKTNM